MFITNLKFDCVCRAITKKKFMERPIALAAARTTISVTILRARGEGGFSSHSNAAHAIAVVLVRMVF
ncbi:hypothetical protein AZI98_08275 [Aeribacillus pallidus]|uniref:Uncharacterized protein n=1 Tax=Aeribacillus pallidus TaxID=33936 RepID=A0A165XZH0_9BACI|nr:hypothetical protein AZI98_08275 [Aeribacillus pallidus]